VKGRDIFVEQASEDMYAAIDQLMDKLDRQVVRHKDRVQDHHHPARPSGWTRPRTDARADGDDGPSGPFFVVPVSDGQCCCNAAIAAHSP
jgi:hypothetical protein